jgi:hypothetical protein
VTNIKLRTNDKHSFISVNPERTAIIIIDIWDNHWCKRYKKLNNALAKRVNSFIFKARRAGIKIIHSPCGSGRQQKPFRGGDDHLYSCMPYYQDHQARHNAIKCLGGDIIKYSKLKKPKDIFFKGVKTGDKLCACKPFCKRPWPRPWTHQHDAITITNQDYITDDLANVRHILCQNNINNLFYVGGALNACLIDRPHSMIVKYENITSGFIRDLTISHLPPQHIFEIDPNNIDSQHWPGWELVEKFDNICKEYNIKTANGSLSYKTAHEAQSKYIEKHLCPSVLSEDLLNACVT